MQYTQYYIGDYLTLDPIGPHALRDYQTWYADPDQKDDSVARPRTRDEIRDWLFEVTENGKNCYFLIQAKGKNIGHLGIREINRQASSGMLDLYLPEQDRQTICKLLVGWLNYFLVIHLKLQYLTVPGYQSDVETVLEESGFRLTREGADGPHHQTII